MSQNGKTVIDTEDTNIDSRTNEEIVAQIQAGINVQYNKDILCKKNGGLISHCIKKYISHFSMANAEEREDFVQEGYIGVLEAASAYKPGSSKFSNYATWYIRKNLYAHCRFKRTSLFIARHYWEGIIKFQKASRQLEQEGKNPTYENIAQLIDVTPYTFQTLSRANEMLNVVSLNERCLSDNESAEFWEFLEADDDIEAEVTQKIYHEQIEEALNSNKAVSKRVSKMIHERFFDGMMFKDIAEQNNCSKQNAEMVVNEGIDKMCAYSNFTAFFVDEETALKEATRRRDELLNKRRKHYNDKSKEYHRQYYLRKKQEKAARMTE